MLRARRDDAVPGKQFNLYPNWPAVKCAGRKFSKLVPHRGHGRRAQTWTLSQSTQSCMSGVAAGANRPLHRAESQAESPGDRGRLHRFGTMGEPWPFVRVGPYGPLASFSPSTTCQTSAGQLASQPHWASTGAAGMHCRTAQSVIETYRPSRRLRTPAPVRGPDAVRRTQRYRPKGSSLRCRIAGKQCGLDRSFPA